VCKPLSSLSKTDARIIVVEACHAAFYDICVEAIQAAVEAILAYAESYEFLGIAIFASFLSNLLLNSDILDILKPSTLYWKSQ